MLLRRHNAYHLCSAWSCASLDAPYLQGRGGQCEGGGRDPHLHWRGRPGQQQAGRVHLDQRRRAADCGNVQGHYPLGLAAGQLPGGTKHAGGLRQAGRVQGTFDFQKGDAVPIGREDYFRLGDLQRRDSVGDKGLAAHLTKPGQVGKRAVGRLGQGWCRLQQGLQAVDVFLEQRFAVEREEALDGLLFHRRAGRCLRRQAALVPARVAATEVQHQGQHNAGQPAQHGTPTHSDALLSSWVLSDCTIPHTARRNLSSSWGLPGVWLKKCLASEKTRHTGGRPRWGTTYARPLVL